VIATVSYPRDVDDDQKAARQRARVPSELCNHRAGFIAHRDVVDAAALTALPLLGVRDEAHAEPARRDVGNRALLRHGRIAVRVAGERER